MVLSKKAPGSTHVQRKKTCSKSKHQREVSDKKMIVGHKTNTSNKYHVLVCGDCDVADIYQHMEYSIPVDTPFLLFGETDKRYGGFKQGKMGEYFSIKMHKNGKYSIKGRIDWEDGIEMITNQGYTVVHMEHDDLVEVPGYTFKSVCI